MSIKFIPRTLPRATGYTIAKVNITRHEGLIREGSVEIVNTRGKHTRYEWSARYTRPDGWKIEGKGAIGPDGGHVPNKETYPFSLDPVENAGLKVFLVEYLEEDRKLSKVNGNGHENGKAPVVPISKIEQVAPAKSPASPYELIIEVSRLKVFVGQPRKHFKTENLGLMAKSLQEHGQLIPVLVIKSTDPSFDYELVDGERRFRAAQIAGITTLRAVLTTVRDVVDQHFKSTLTNFHREAHTVIETSNALYFQSEHGKSVKELATIVGFTEQIVYQYLSYQKLHPELMILLDESTLKRSRLSKQIAYWLSRAPKEDQLQLYAQFSGIENPKLRKVRAKEVLEPFIEKKESRKKNVSDDVEAFVNFVIRLNGELEITKRFPSHMYPALIGSRQDRLPELKRLLSKAQVSLKEISDEIERVEGILKQK